MKAKLSSYYFMFFFAAGALFPFISLYLKSKGFSATEIGYVFACGSLIGIVAQPLIGILSDAAHDYRNLIKLSVVLSAICVNGYFISDNLILVIVIQVIMVILMAPLMPVVDSIAVDQAPAHGYTYGQVRLWGAFSWTIVNLVAGLFFKRVGFDYIFPAYSILSIFTLIIVFRFPKIDRPKHVRSKVREGVKTLVRNKLYLYFVFLGMIASILVAMNGAFLPIYYSKLGYPIELVGWNFAAASIVEIPLFMYVAKRVHRKNLVLLITLGALAFAVKYGLMGFAPPAPILIGLQALDGVGFVLTISAVMEIINLLTPDNVKATGQTIYSSIGGGIAGVVGNLVGGFIYDHQGPQVLFWAMGGVGLLLVVAYALFPLHIHEEEPTST
jgi:MFS family permease